MNVSKLAPFAIAFAMLAGSQGKMQRFINAIRHTQIQLIQDSKASKWPKAPMLQPFKR